MKHEFKRQAIALLDQHRIMTIATNRPVELAAPRRG